VAVGASSSRSGSRSPTAAAAAQRPALLAKRALFSGRGALLAVALEDDSVLVARVEHFTSGARAGEELRVSVCSSVYMHCVYWYTAVYGVGSRQLKCTSAVVVQA
jgi:hypothetical protein